jgi:hypothetical protein
MCGEWGGRRERFLLGCPPGALQLVDQLAQLQLARPLGVKYSRSTAGQDVRRVGVCGP